MKRILSMALALVLLMGMFVSVAYAEEEPITLVIIEQYGSEERDALIQQMVTDAGYNYKLEFIDAPNDMTDKILMRVQTGQQLDMLLDCGIVDTTLINGGYLKNLDENTAAWEDFAKMDQSLISLVKSYDGSIYAIPIEKYQRILFYRSDWLKELGYDAAPASWADLYKISQELTDASKNRYGFSFRGGSGTAGMFEQVLLGMFDRALIDPINVYVTTEGYCMADDRYKDVFEAALKEFKWQYETISPADSITWGYPEMVEGFYSGTTAFLIQTAEVIATCKDYMEEGAWNTAMMPVGSNGASYSPVNAGGMAILNTSEYQEAVWNVISVVGGYEGSKKFAEFYGTTPMYAYDDFGDSYYDAYSQMLENADTQITYLSNTLSCTTEEFEYMSNIGGLGGYMDLVLQEYVTGQIDEQGARERWLEYYGWMEDSEWIAARRAAQ